MIELKKLAEQNKNGYIFSLKGGKLPVNADTMRKDFFKALSNIGIKEKQRRERNICFHSWRHYLNTTMRSNNIMDGKLRAMVGHSSSKMTECIFRSKMDTCSGVNRTPIPFHFGQ
jgi:integrase